jgi:hypothetical protein
MFAILCLRSLSKATATWRLVELCLSEHGCDIEVSGSTQLLQTHWKLLTPRLYSANASDNISM